MTLQDKKQIMSLLKKEAKSDPKFCELWDLMKIYFDGNREVEDDIDRVIKLLENKVLSAQLIIIMDQVKRTVDRVYKILYRLSNIKPSDDQSKKDVIHDLKQNGLITEEQEKKLIISPNKISAFAKIVTGAGLYMSKKPH